MDGDIPLPYQLFYTIIPTIGLIGNGSVVYVTIRSRNLRSACNIFIALISLGDTIHMLAHFIMIASYYTSPNHLIRHDVCVRWQLLPTFGMCFSIVLLFNVAIDRLMSLHRLYNGISKAYKSLYVGLQISVAVALSTFTVVLVYISRRTDREVVCAMTSAMHGQVKEVFFNGATLLMVLILACYALFLIKIRKTTITDRNSKSVYRSLILVSLTVVFGWFSTTGIATILSILRIDLSDLIYILVAGIFTNLSMMSNFLIYYIMSGQYREAFDHYLHFGKLKNLLGLKNKTNTSRLPPIITSTSGRSST